MNLDLVVDFARNPIRRIVDFARLVVELARVPKR